MIALFAAPLLAAAGMAYSAPLPACATGVDCGGYRPANPNIVFAKEHPRPAPQPYPVIGGDPATWTPQQPPVVGGNPATWSQQGGYAYGEAAYAQQAYGQATYAQSAYGYAAPAPYAATAGFEVAQGYGQAYAPPAQVYGGGDYVPAQATYVPNPAAYGYGQQAYAGGGYAQGYGYGAGCGSCQAAYAPPAPVYAPPVYSPCGQPAPCAPAPQFEEISVRGDVYSGGVGITDVGGGGGGGGGGNFEVQGYGDISGFVGQHQQVWANATANANANSNAYANASNSVNIDISNTIKGGWGGKGGGHKPGKPSTPDCNCETPTPPPTTGCNTCGGVGMGGWGGHKSGGMGGGWGGKSGWGGGVGGCNTCGGSSSGGSKMGGWGRRH